MNKKGDFYTSYELVLSIARILILIIFLLSFSAMIGSSAVKKVDTWEVESKEFFNSLIHCSTTGNKLDETKLNDVEKCLKTKDYGAEISYKDKKIIVNKDKYGSLFGLCNTKSIYCNELTYFDGVNKLKVNILVIKNE
ncbi:hypothetical protein HYV88_04575 [Candidatus Woesearchaeota archaeon]|nr:hypothetical protein [Candidatus Woesearchaeota archaeon]